MTDFVNEKSTQHKTEDSDETDSVSSLKLADYPENSRAPLKYI